MSENLRTYTKAVYGFDHVMRLAQAKEKTWTKKAPCAGWTGKDVYEHAAGGVKQVQSFAATGKGPSGRSMPKLGAKPMVGWAKVRDTTLETLDQPGALQTIAVDPFGPEFGSIPVDTYLDFMAAELTVHTWDLARTARVDEQLDPSLVKMATATWKSLSNDVVRGEGMMAEAIKPEKGVDAQTRLLNFLGRTV